MPKRPNTIAFRISDRGRSLLYAMQDHWGLSQAGVFELLLRNAARDAGFDVNDPPRSLTSTLAPGNKGGRHG